MSSVDVRPRWGLREAVLAIVAGIVLQVLAVSILLAVTGRTGDEADDLSLVEIALLNIPLWIGMLGVPWWVTTRRGDGIVAELGVRQKATDVPMGLALGVALQAIVVPLLYLPLFWLVPDFDRESIEKPARELSDKATGLGVLLLVLVVVVAAPIVEEICYRGMLRKAIDVRYGPAWAVGASSVIFAANHFQLVQFPALLVFGLTAGLLAQRTGRLGLSIWLHVGFNAWSVFALLVLTN